MSAVVGIDLGTTKSAVAAWEGEASAAASAKEVEDMKGMSKCSECGSVIPAEAGVCPDCGADFSDDDDEGMDVEEEEDLDEDEE